MEVEENLPNTGGAALRLTGFSGITAPNSYGYQRNFRVNSDNFIPYTRGAFLFAESENNCGNGSTYNLQNNTLDQSTDYNFHVYASGFGVHSSNGSPVFADGQGHVVESGFYQQSSRFGATTLAGSGVGRFLIV